jgi:hypothetical protein
MLGWDNMSGDAKSLAQNFIKQKSVEESSLYRGLLVSLAGALEQFVRRILRDAVLGINGATDNYDDLHERIKLQNVFRTGQALQTIFEPPDHLNFDYEMLGAKLGGCVKGSKAFELNADAFTIYVSSIAPPHLEEVLKRIGLELNWDHIGQDNDLQKFFDEKGAHSTGKAVQHFLAEVIRKRNKIAHSGSGGVAISDSEFTQTIKFFRFFSEALSKTVGESLAKSVTKRKSTATAR